MRYFPIWHSSVACLLVSVICTHTIGTASPKDKPVVPAKDGEPAAIEVKEIELSKIYSTSGQTKLKILGESLPEDSAARKALSAMEASLLAAKSQPVIGIVRGENIQEAVIASGRLVDMKKPPKSAVGPDETSTSSNHWLFVYLGATHSSPRYWIVDSVQMSGTRFRFSYSVDDFWPADGVGGG